MAPRAEPLDELLDQAPGHRRSEHRATVRSYAYRGHEPVLRRVLEEEAARTSSERLRERTETFEQAVEAGRFTKQEFDQLTQSGDKIDETFEQLRKEGFLPEAEEHEEE